MLSDTVGDFLTRIRNAQSARHRVTKVLFSKINSSVLKILKGEGYISDYNEEFVGKIPYFNVKLKYYNNMPVINNIVRISKPGCRRYYQYKNIFKAYNGLGIFIISTSKGVMTDHDACKLKVGGEVLCRVF